MTKDYFIAALQMLGFKNKSSNVDETIYYLYIGHKNKLTNNDEFYVNVTIFNNWTKNTPYIEIEGSDATYIVFSDYKKAYKFTIKMELNN